MRKCKEEKAKENHNSAWKIFLKYTEDSTIQGLIYIFFPYQVWIVMIYRSDIFVEILWKL
jgi:hypothetical protein